ncbi:Multidrug resistance protein [Verticillium dahliae VDG1]|nr:Multidrug resistance protein [Verticillium dahliae VDG1]
MLMTFHDFWHLDIPLNRRYNPCKPGVIAYALPSQSFMIAGTSDCGGYGYNFVQSLTAAQNLNHADTYTLFAQSIFARC